jgi:hypothetical protein
MLYLSNFECGECDEHHPGTSLKCSELMADCWSHIALRNGLRSSIGIGSNITECLEPRGGLDVLLCEVFCEGAPRYNRSLQAPGCRCQPRRSWSQEALPAGPRSRCDPLSAPSTDR